MNLDFDNRKHRKDFENEVKRLASLDHPNIVRLLEAHRNERCCKSLSYPWKIIVNRECMIHDVLKEDALKKDALKEDALKEDALKEDALKEDALKEDTLKERHAGKLRAAASSSFSGQFDYELVLLRLLQARHES